MTLPSRFGIQWRIQELVGGGGGGGPTGEGVAGGGAKRGGGGGGGAAPGRVREGDTLPAQLGGLGERCKLPQRGSGAKPQKPTLFALKNPQN